MKRNISAQNNQPGKQRMNELKKASEVYRYLKCLREQDIPENLPYALK